MWTSPYAPVEVGGTTLHRMVPSAAARFGDRPALVDGPSGTTVSYRLLAERVQGVAAGLAATGFRPGRRARPVGAEPAPVGRGRPRRHGRRGTVTGPARPARARAGHPAGRRRGLGPGDRPVAGPGGPFAPRPPPGARWSCSAGRGRHPDRRGRRAPHQPGPAPTRHRGRPAPLLERHHRAAQGRPADPRQPGHLGAPGRRRAALGQGDTLLAVAPFFPRHGVRRRARRAAVLGRDRVTMPRFDPGPFLELMRRTGSPSSSGPRRCCGSWPATPLAAAADLRSLELVVCGGAPLTRRRPAGRRPGLPGAVGQGYGLTETTVGVSMPDRAAGSVPGTVGRVMPSTELRVADPETGATWGRAAGRAAGPRPQVMAGYLGRPEATAAMVGPAAGCAPATSAWSTPTGNVVIVDRLKELIKVSGAGRSGRARGRCWPPTRPCRRGRARPPGPGQGRGPGGRGRGPAGPTAEELLAWVAERVEPHKRLRAVRFTDAIPTHPVGEAPAPVLVEQERQAV